MSLISKRKKKHQITRIFGKVLFAKTMYTFSITYRKLIDFTFAQLFMTVRSGSGIKDVIQSFCIEITSVRKAIGNFFWGINLLT